MRTHLKYLEFENAIEIYNDKCSSNIRNLLRLLKSENR
jgi:hypothetical protein